MIIIYQNIRNYLAVSYVKVILGGAFINEILKNFSDFDWRTHFCQGFGLDQHLLVIEVFYGSDEMAIDQWKIVWPEFDDSIH